MIDFALEKYLTFSKKRPKHILSIEFGRAFCKLAYLQLHKKGINLLDWRVEKLSLAGGGKPEELTALIRSFLEKNSSENPEFYLTIPDFDSAAIKHLQLPVLPRQEVIGAAKWQLKEDLAFDLEKAVIGWELVREYSDQEGTKKNEIVFALVEEKALNEYIGLVKELNLKPSKISLAPLNYGNILKKYFPDSGTQVVLDLSYDQTTLYIYIQGRLKFIRKLPFSSQKLTQDLTGTLVSDKGKTQLSYQEAENIKQAFGIPQDQSQDLGEKITAIQMISLLRPHLELLVKELKRTSDYFSSEFNQPLITRLCLVGGGSNLKNLDSFLAKELSFEVSPLVLPDFGPESASFKDLGSNYPQLLSAIGAALADSAAINLLPQEIKAQKSELIQKISLRVSAVAIVAIFLFSFFMVRLKINDYKSRIANAQKHLETISEIRVLRQNILARDGLIIKLQKGKVPVDKLLIVLSNLVPNEITLESLALKQDAATLVLKGQIQASGAVAETALTQFMKKLEASDFFTEAALTSSKKEGLNQSFEIRCDISG